MKRKYFAMALMGALAGLSSCSEEEELSSLAPTQNGVLINAEIVGYEDPTHARTVIDNEGKVKWEEGEKLYIGWKDDYVMKGENNGVYESTLQYQSGNFSFYKGRPIDAQQNEKYYLVALNTLDEANYFTYSANEQKELTKFTTRYSLDTPFAIQDEKKPYKGVGEQDLMSGVAVTTLEGNVFHIKMKHLLSLLKFNIVNKTGKAFVVRNFSLKTPEGVFISGRFQPTYLPNEQGEFVLDPKSTYADEKFSQSNVASVLVKHALKTEANDSYEVSALTLPFDLVKGQQLSITVETSVGKFTHTYPVKNNLSFKAGALSTATVEVDRMDANYSKENLYIADSAFRNYLIQEFDKNKDNKLSENELKGVGSLSLNSLGIRTLEGIENLPDLKELVVDDSKLVQADLTKNTQLKKLSLSNCGQLNKLEIQGLTSLESLEIVSKGYYGTVPLNNLDLTGCDNLTSMELNNMRIDKLYLKGLNKLANLTLGQMEYLGEVDVHECPALTTVKIAKSKLTSLNVSGLTQMTNLNANNNAELAHINMSGCTGLTNLELISNAKLQNLDLSEATALKRLTVKMCDLRSLNLLQNKELTYVDIYNNLNLGTLDVSGLSKLEDLDVTSNNLTSLKLAGCSMISKLTVNLNKLTELDVSECNHKLGSDIKHIFNVGTNYLLEKIYVWDGFEVTNFTLIPSDAEIIKKK